MCSFCLSPSVAVWLESLLLYLAGRLGHPARRRESKEHRQADPSRPAHYDFSQATPKLQKMAQTALQDRKPEVRIAAATAMGLMGSYVAIPGLKKALSDRNPRVVLAVAHALQVLNDPAGYEVYYEVLTGERKSAGVW